MLNLKLKCSKHQRNTHSSYLLPLPLRTKQSLELWTFLLSHPRQINLHSENVLQLIHLDKLALNIYCMLPLTPIQS